MFADIIFAEDIDFIVIIMMVQCQPPAFTFILRPIYCCRGQWNYKYVCPLPSNQESLLGQEASPDDLELSTIPRMTVIRSHSLVCWNDPKNVGIAKISQNRGEKSRSVTRERRKVSPRHEARGNETKRRRQRSEGKWNGRGYLGRRGHGTGSGHPCCLRDPSASSLLTHDTVTQSVHLSHCHTWPLSEDGWRNREPHTKHIITSILLSVPLFSCASHHFLHLPIRH